MKSYKAFEKGMICRGKQYKENERLIELLEQAFLDSDDNYGTPNINQVADYLIENGVVIPPLKIDDKVYIVDEYSNEDTGIDECVVSKIIIEDNDGCFSFMTWDTLDWCYSCYEIGKTIFLTLEEAEKALEGSEE